MAKVAPDYSFERGGISLGDWLWRLVDNDRAERERAGAALQAMSYGVPGANTQLQDVEPIPDTRKQGERFDQAIRDAVVAPGFDTAEFIRKLCAYRVTTSDDWLRRVDERYKKSDPAEAQYERIADRLIAKINASPDEAVREDASKKLARAIGASCKRDWERDQRINAGAEAMTMASFMAFRVVKSLDQAYLAAPEALLFMLEHRQQAHEAIEALERIGPAAKAFAPILIERMDHIIESGDDRRPHFDAAAALGAIGRDDPAIVDAMIQRLQHSNVAIRAAAADTLTRMDGAVAGRAAIILPLLHVIFDAAIHDGGEELWAVVNAMAAVGRHDAASRQRVIDLARPRPPRMVSPPDFPQYAYDQTMHERGLAIAAMRYLTDYPADCVPVLIDAVDTFAEYDPDECYSGPIGRVSHALSLFGLSAGPEAAATLVRHLRDQEGESPKAILAALAAMGPAAEGVVPILEEFRVANANGESLAELGDAAPDPYDDPVGLVIHQIRAAAGGDAV